MLRESIESIDRRFPVGQIFERILRVDRSQSRRAYARHRTIEKARLGSNRNPPLFRRQERFSASPEEDLGSKIGHKLRDLRRENARLGVTRRDVAWRINASADNAVVRSENYLPARLIRVQMKPHITRQESSRYDAVTRKVPIQLNQYRARGKHIFNSDSRSSGTSACTERHSRARARERAGALQRRSGRGQ